MNHNAPQGNASAIQRFQLIDRVRSSQSRLSRHAKERFDDFSNRQGGAIFEFGCERSLERAFMRFEWDELDRLYSDLFYQVAGLHRCNVRAHTRAVRTIAFDKLMRVFIKAWFAGLGLMRKCSELTVLACMFVAISSITSEAILHFTR